MNIKFKNPKLNELVQSVTEYGNLILNDVEMDGDGKVVTKKEKPRSDEKVSRQYYNAAFLSLDNNDAARVITMWQSHQKDGQTVIWKNAFNPLVAAMKLGSAVAGKICFVKFNEEYSIGMNVTNKATLYVPHEDSREKVIEEFAIANGLLIEEDNGIINDGDDTLKDKEVEETETPENGTEGETPEGNQEPVMANGEQPESKGKPKGKKDDAPVTGTN